MDPCYKIGRDGDIPTFQRGPQGDAYWGRYGGVRVGDQFCGGTTGGKSTPPGTPVDGVIEWATTAIGQVAAPVAELVKILFGAAPPPVKASRPLSAAEAALAATTAPAAAVEPAAKPAECGCHGNRPTPLQGLLLALALYAAWKAWKR